MSDTFSSGTWEELRDLTAGLAKKRRQAEAVVRADPLRFPKWAPSCGASEAEAEAAVRRLRELYGPLGRG